MSAARPTVLITGAAGHLGQVLARSFLQGGARLLLLDLRVDTLQPFAADRENVRVCAVNLLEREALRSCVDQAVRSWGRLDSVCHIAGGFRMGEAVHETSTQTWDFLMDLNARSLIHVAACTVPHLIAAGGGSVVTVGAGAAQRGSAHMGAYGASKSALMRLTEAMSAELRDQAIRVNCVLPSIIDTPDNRIAMPEADFSRWVAPSALADVITFLTSPPARAIHGASIPVTGRV